MAVAPLNRFLTKAVPVAPGQQLVYEAPAGTSAIVLYASIANVGAGTTYPKATFTHRRTSTATRTVGNVRETDLIKEVEIPPNDSLIVIDGRLVLERTSSVKDSVLVNGIQSGITTVYDAQYNNTTGLTTITTYTAHGFSVGDDITLAGLAFTCPSTAGITGPIFPEPQASFKVETVETSTVFTTNTGIVNTLPHTFRPSLHEFVRAETNAVGIVTATTSSLEGTYLQAVKGTTYDSVTGILSVTTSTDHGLFTNDTVGLGTEKFVFKCSQDNYFKEKKYPRTTDPAHFNPSNPLNNGGLLGITTYSSTTFSVNVGVQTGGGLVGPLQMELIMSILENSTV